MLTGPARQAWTPTGARALPPPGIMALLVALLVLGALGYADALRLPFLSDDYLYLDETRGATLASVWAPTNLVSGYYRPWSRELHFWALQRIFGAQSAPFHLANLALWLGILTSYFALVRRLAGGRSAAVAASGIAALSSWGVLLVWASGAQDLWMLLFAMAYLQLCVRGRPGWAAPVFGLALLSKESALVLPIVAVSYHVLVEQRTAAVVLRRTWPSWLLVVLWALAHPSLGGRLWSPAAAHFSPGSHSPLSWSDLVRVMALANLDPAPAPAGGWKLPLLLGAATALILAGFTGWGAATRHGPGPAGELKLRPGRRRLMLFGVTWFAVAWLPVLMPSLGWHGYYGLLGSLGAWLGIATFVSSRPALAVLLVGAVALLRPAQARTLTDDWGTEAHQRLAATMVGTLRDEMTRLHPTFPHYSRIYLANLPGDLCLMIGPGDSPTVRTWYADSTLRVGFFQEYVPRAPGEPDEDYFFAADSRLTLIEFRRDRYEVPPSLARNPVWLLGENEIATIFSDHGEWAKALEGFLRLARIDSTAVDYAHNVGVCYARLGRTTEAKSWLERAAVLRARAVSPPGGARGR
jgi:hypothetical protein